jgi:hypothetical protein
MGTLRLSREAKINIQQIIVTLTMLHSKNAVGTAASSRARVLGSQDTVDERWVPAPGSRLSTAS